MIISSLPQSRRQIRPSKYPSHPPPMGRKPSVSTPIPTPVPAHTEKQEQHEAHEFEQYHGVYATAKSSLADAVSGEEVVPEATRVCMVYPMKVDGNEKVIMRTKRVNCMTGQLSYHWVVIYDPTKEERYLSDFSIVP